MDAGAKSSNATMTGGLWNQTLNHSTVHVLQVVLALTTMIQCSAAALGQSEQTTFPTPEKAVSALRDAAQLDDRETLRQVFGPQVQRLATGDDVQDSVDLELFARRLEKARIDRKSENRAIVLVGVEEHPFPVPIVRVNSRWHFDTDAGLDEILNRRIGENELRAIDVCRTYVLAQREYFLADWDGDDVLEYAQNMSSAPGKKDGLYWPEKPGQPMSPLGPLVAEAQSEGYVSRSGDGPRPYHGYFYRILKGQAQDSPGGAFSYVINGNMVAGFAMIAYPSEWGASGIMTFVVNASGNVYEKNLGKETARIAPATQSFSVDDTWKRVSDD